MNKPHKSRLPVDYDTQLADIVAKLKEIASKDGNRASFSGDTNFNNNIVKAQVR